MLGQIKKSLEKNGTTHARSNLKNFRKKMAQHMLGQIKKLFKKGQHNACMLSVKLKDLKKDGRTRTCLVKLKDF